MRDNVLPFKKSDRFGVYLGDVTSSGEIIEGEGVGMALLKPGSKKFRLKLWIMPSHQYFIIPDDKDDKKYVVLSLEEYQAQSGETKSVWNKIGYGNLIGNFVALRIQLIPETLFLSLFPETNKPVEEAFAS